MQKIDAALDWARRGFRVFPLKENSKVPAFNNWITMATSNEEAVRNLWQDPVLGSYKDYNIGCLCNDMVVVDIDVKEGKDGINEYAEIGGGYDTLVVQTPTGGFHCYFNGPDSSNSAISKSVDIRSHNGFVVAPGSTIEGQPYSVITDRSMGWIPVSVEKLLTSAYKREGAVADFTVDSEASIQAAIDYLQSAPPAVEGNSGDETTFKTAARLVREMGISLANACVLMRDYYNPRCSPPWPVDELYKKVENANDYGTAAQGRLSSEVLFGHITPLLTPPPSLFVQKGLEFGNAVDPISIPARPWLLHGMLMKQNVTLLLAPGSVGKSSLSIAFAAHIARGEEFLGQKADRPYKTIVYNAEDDLDEQSRRLLAMCIKHGFDYRDVVPNLMLLSQQQIRLNLVNEEFRQPIMNETVVRQLIEKASDPDVGLLVIDPLVKVHSIDEGDNSKMDFVMETLQYIAREADVAVMALHHVNKGGDRSGRTGDADISRGASAITNAARVAFTLLTPTDDDAEQYGFKDDQRNSWVRMDDAKMNLTLSRSKPNWFKKEGVGIASGDVVGVLKHEDIEKCFKPLHIRIAEQLANHMGSLGSGAMGVKEAANILKENEPLWANKTPAQIIQRLEGMYTVAVDVGTGGQVKFERTHNKTTGKDDLKILYYS